MTDKKRIIAAKELPADAQPPPPVDAADLKKMINNYGVLVKKLLDVEDLWDGGVYKSRLGRDARRMLAVNASEQRLIPDFTERAIDEIIERAPLVAHALLRFSLEVAFIGPIIDELLERQTVRTFIRSRLRKAKMIEDVISEIYYVGWLEQKGLKTTSREEVGLPDAAVIFEKQELQIELKTVHSLNTNIQARINDANKQIKNVGDDATGVCVIRYPTALDAQKRESSLAKIIERIYRVTGSNNCRSVAAVILQWDEVTHELRDRDLWLFASRGSRLYPHAHARRPLEGNLQELCPCGWIVSRTILRPTQSTAVT